MVASDGSYCCTANKGRRLGAHQLRGLYEELHSDNIAALGVLIVAAALQQTTDSSGICGVCAASFSLASALVVWHLLDIFTLITSAVIVAGPSCHLAAACKVRVCALELVRANSTLVTMGDTKIREHRVPLAHSSQQALSRDGETDAKGGQQKRKERKAWLLEGHVSLSG